MLKRDRATDLGFSRRGRRTAALLFLLASTAFVWAQSPATPPKQDAAAKPAADTTIRSRSQLVLVPAVVINHGKPVRGLTKDNFRIEDNGKTQPIQLFEAVETKAADRATPAAKTPGVFTNATTDEPRTLTLIAFDGINTPLAYQAEARKDLLKFLAKNLPPNQMVGVVVFTRKGVKLISDFTVDTSTLIAALQQATGVLNRYSTNTTKPVSTASTTGFVGTQGASPSDSGLMSSNPGALKVDAGELHAAAQGGDITMNVVANQLVLYLQSENKVAEFQNVDLVIATLENMQQVAHGLAGYPGRKALIWASASFEQPVDPTRFRQTQLNDMYQRTLRDLADANVAVYPVDLKGTQVSSPGADATVTRFDRAAGINPAAAKFQSDALKATTFRNFADSTGGRVFFDINNNDKAFQVAIDDSQAYYLLGYYVPADTKPGWHALKVKTEKADGAVHARTGYFYTSTALDAKASRQSDLSLGMRSPIDYTALRVNARFVSTTSVENGKKQVKFELKLPPTDTLVGPESLLNMDFVAVARTADSTVAGQSARLVETQINPETSALIAREGIAFQNSIDLPPGTYRVRFLVRDNLTGRMGSLEAPLKVE